MLSPQRLNGRLLTYQQVAIKQVGQPAFLLIQIGLQTGGSDWNDCRKTWCGKNLVFATSGDLSSLIGVSKGTPVFRGLGKSAFKRV